MLTVINLYTIDKIFKEVSEIKLSAIAKMLYVSCLTKHFSDKKPTTVDANAFEMLKADIPFYDKFEVSFNELQKGGLVAITEAEIRFYNCWNKYIDKSRLDKVSVDVFVANLQSIDKFEEDLRNAKNMHEFIQLKHGINKKQLSDLIELFIKEQKAFEKKYTGWGDCAKHFSYWLPNNKDKSQNTNVKTNAKILGLKK